MKTAKSLMLTFVAGLIVAPDVKGKPVEMGSASVLLKLAAENDRMFTY